MKAIKSKILSWRYYYSDGCDSVEKIWIPQSFSLSSRKSMSSKYSQLSLFLSFPLSSLLWHDRHHLIYGRYFCIRFPNIKRNAKTITNSLSKKGWKVLENCENPSTEQANDSISICKYCKYLIKKCSTVLWIVVRNLITLRVIFILHEVNACQFFLFHTHSWKGSYREMMKTLNCWE